MRVRLLKICIGEWNNASRDMRELSVYRELGADVLVLAKGKPKDRGRLDKVATFKVHRFTTRPLRTSFPTAIQRLVAIFQWARYAKKLNADIISGHDLIGLLIGWMSNWFLPRRKRAKLIYDSHEFELGRNVKRNHFQTWVVKQVERFLIRRSVFTVVVNDFIADEVARIYNLDRRPIVIRNIPKPWDMNPIECVEVRNSFMKELRSCMKESCSYDLGSEGLFLLMYHGALINDRGIEAAIDVLAKNEGVYLILMGNGEDEYIGELRDRAKEIGVSDKLLIMNAVPQDEIWKYVGAVDVGMVLLLPTCENHLYSLSNKFFENIHALTPVICSDFPAMKEIVDKYRIGLTCDPTNLEAISDCVERFRTDRDFLSLCKKNTSIAKRDLNWENEKSLLASAYLNLCSSLEHSNH